MCGLFPCIPIFGGIYLIKKCYGIGGLIFCVKLIRQITAVHSTFLVRISLYLVQEHSSIFCFKCKVQSVLRSVGTSEIILFLSIAIQTKSFINVGFIVGVNVGNG